MLLSGHIDFADDFNMRLIKEGTSYYKYMRPFIEKAFAVFPIGHTPINRKEPRVLGLKVPSAGKMFLFVWRVDTPESDFRIDLSKYFTCIKSIKIGYPVDLGGVTFDVDKKLSKLKIHFTGNRQARLFEIDYLS